MLQFSQLGKKEKKKQKNRQGEKEREKTCVSRCFGQQHFFPFSYKSTTFEGRQWSEVISIDITSV